MAERIDCDDDALVEDPYVDSGSDYQPEQENSDSHSDASDINDFDVSLTKQRSRKSVRNQGDWARNIRKRSRAKGMAYTNSRKQKIAAKLFVDKPCNCQNLCNSKISSEQRYAIFQNFYSLGDFDLQTAYLCGQITVVKKHRIYTKHDTQKRKNTRIYRLPNENGQDISVCKKYFETTLQVSDGRLTRALRNKSDGLPPPVDLRGKAAAANKTPQHRESEVMCFIRKFPTYQSHYSRAKNFDRKYLAPDLNISIMYSLYKQCHGDSVSAYVFRTIFNTKFNLHFHTPVTDSCRKCDSFEVKLTALNDGEEKQSIAIQKELHIRKAEMARHEMKRDSETASLTESDTTAIAFDLMKTLPTPVLSTGITYYKRQLWTYCLGIHDLSANKSVMYIWNESVASRGPQEIGSCIMHYCKHFVHTSKLITYSDQCGGQNRNVKMASILHYIACSPDYTVDQVDQKFLVSGHSYLPCDQDFGLIEKQKRYHPNIFVPDDWIPVIKSARKKQPFDVVVMGTADFKSCGSLLSCITNRKTDEDGNKVEWMKMQWLSYSKSSRFVFSFKYSNNPEVPFSKVNVAKRKVSPLPIQLECLYPNGRQIDKKKIDNLKELLPYVPPVHHAFYKNLRSSVNVEDDFGDPEDGTVDME